ncbi:hypothetical protein Tco_0843219 [Tanacetum coccineum]|uniref:Uncharacterized protein n=1 Tax=Tanacetum coccineum TaxID=301880 RepID=A0ABQ5B515_9ASTR
MQPRMRTRSAGRPATESLGGGTGVRVGIGGRGRRHREEGVNGECRGSQWGSTPPLTLLLGLDYGFVSTVDAEARRQEISEVGYGIRDTWVDPAEAVPEIAPITVGEVNTRVTELAELYEHDTQDLYALLEDAQDSRSRISQRVNMDSQRVDLLMGEVDDALGDSMDGEGGGLCFPRGLGSLDRIESGDSSGASDPP